MAVTLTTETITGASGETETIVVARELYTSGTSENDLEVSIAVDNTAYLDRIATALETIATNSTTIANEITTIDDNVSTIANEITTIDDHIERLKTLGDQPDGPGIRTVQPFGLLGTAILYHLYVNQGQILEEEASEQVKTNSLNKYQEVINDLIANFDPNQGGF